MRTMEGGYLNNAILNTTYLIREHFLIDIIEATTESKINRLDNT